MPKLNYETADVLVYDPVAGHRNATRGALYTLGFKKVTTCGMLAALDHALRYSPPDLVFCEAEGSEDELCKMIQAVRQSGTHVNPFLVIIVTAWEKSRALVHQVLNSGADDLILRPLTANLLKARIDSHVERRKQFVVTHDYIGPDRRSDPNRVSKIPLFQPPNSLKMKVADGMLQQEAAYKLQQELRVALDLLWSEKLRREVFQICALWRLLQDSENPATDPNLAKLQALALVVAKRCVENGIDAAQHWCDSIKTAVEGLYFGVDRNASMHLLGQAALNLNQIVSPELPRADHLQALDEVVTMIRNRPEPAADVPDLKQVG
ncbi:DNA-binding response OmpR family regulator [Rhizomicrobium palustre]|uniref:DNA-binding response OmpR family regulator n=1 Tax=Rhizomicrobium palustre TaxID=189966 RepID=A0A846N2J0_9PROT|nr:hypothetical protein [Rhizomicrobium palustre]NIK89705.1 DNA-binding response OmpR family regulator [Rhizomicrobium palustre]